MTYFERGCAVHGEVSRREGRNCIERVGMLFNLKIKIAKIPIIYHTLGTYKTRMWYCICDNKDGCNKSSNVHKNLHNMFVLPIFLFFYTYFFQVI